MLTDYHNHLETGSLSLDYLMEFIQQANNRGIEHFGISEHAYHFYQTHNIVSNPWMEARRYYDISDYVELFEDAWRQDIPVKMSIEMDYTPGKHDEMKKFINSYAFDYIIGSIHWIDDFGIDLMEYRDEWNRRDLFTIYQKYYDQVITLAESNLFDIIGHIDLVKIFNYIPDDEEFLLEQFDRATTALANSKTCVEISTAGLRKPIGQMYPDSRLLQMCYEKHIPIVLSSDAHYPKDVGYEFEQAVKLAKKCGYQTIMTFDKGQRKEVSLG